MALQGLNEFLLINRSQKFPVRGELVQGAEKSKIPGS